MQNTNNLSAAIFEHGGWKHYNITKKAMEQKFSSEKRGLLISLSIAFFIVLISAQLLSFAYQTMSAQKNPDEQKVYHMERMNRENGRILEYRGLA